MADPRPDSERHDVPPPVKTHTSNGKRIYSQNGVSLDQALSFYSHNKEIKFDSLYPVYQDPKGRTFDPVLGSTDDVDDFIAALPVKEMYDVYKKVFEDTATKEDIHEYVWMLRWLQTSMELSKITRRRIQRRLKFLSIYLRQKRSKLDDHIERYIQMKADNQDDADSIEDHRLEGYMREKGYNLMLFFSMAMDVIDVLASQLTPQLQEHRCECS